MFAFFAKSVLWNDVATRSAGFMSCCDSASGIVDHHNDYPADKSAVKHHNTNKKRNSKTPRCSKNRH